MGASPALGFAEPYGVAVLGCEVDVEDRQRQSGAQPVLVGVPVLLPVGQAVEQLAGDNEWVRLREPGRGRPGCRDRRFVEHGVAVRADALAVGERARLALGGRETVRLRPALLGAFATGSRQRGWLLSPRRPRQLVRRERAQRDRDRRHVNAWHKQRLVRPLGQGETDRCPAGGRVELVRVLAHVDRQRQVGASAAGLLERQLVACDRAVARSARDLRHHPPRLRVVPASGRSLRHDVEHRRRKLLGGECHHDDGAARCRQQLDSGWLDRTGARGGERALRVRVGLGVGLATERK